MSRITVRTFLRQAKRHLQQALQQKGTASFVIGNESADLDSIACALVYGYLQSSKIQARRQNHFLIPVVNIPASDLPLRPELTALLRHADCKPEDLINLDDLGRLPLALQKASWMLVDHNVLPGEVGKHYFDAITGVIDHHEDEGKIPTAAEPRIITKSGSCSSLVVNNLRSTWDAISSASSSVGAANAQSSDGVVDDSAYTSGWDAQVAKLALGAILIDTQNLQDKFKTTEHDVEAVRYLEAKINVSPRYGKDYDRQKFFDEISAAKADLDSLSLEDVLRKDYKSWTEGSLTLGISSVVKPVDHLKSKAGNRNDQLFKSLRDFGTSRHLDIFAVMTAFQDESKEFKRELLVLPLSEHGKKGSQRFVERAAEKLNLRDASSGVVTTSESTSDEQAIKLWQQGNVSASRKQVAPMLRESMKS